MGVVSQACVEFTNLPVARSARFLALMQIGIIRIISTWMWPDTVVVFIVVKIHSNKIAVTFLIFAAENVALRHSDLCKTGIVDPLDIKE